MELTGHEMTQSQLAMWRAFIALSWVDGDQCEIERASIRETVLKLKAPEVQKTELLADLDRDHKIDEFLPLITNPKDKAWLLYMARILFFVDGDFSDREQELLRKLEDLHMSRVDFQSAVAKAREIDVAERHKEAAANQNRSRVEKLLSALEALKAQLF